MLPPPPRLAPAKRKVVLEEDTYAQAIESIVERDFFPHLPKLQNQLEWLHAVQSGDPAAIKRAQLNIARRRAGLRTPLPGETPLMGALSTPGTGLLRTPLMTPAAAGGGMSGATPALGGGGGATPCLPAATPSRTPAGPAVAAALEAEHGMHPIAAQQAAGARAPGLGLDAFFESYQGEDNASFQQLHTRTLERQRTRAAHHLVDANKRLRLEAGGHDTDEYGSSGQAPSTLVPTRHVPRNALYYDSSQRPTLALSDAEAATVVQGPPKAINYAGTRSVGVGVVTGAVTAAAAGSGGGGGGSAAASDEAEALAAAARAHAARLAAAAMAPGTSGYGYERTPQVLPGVGASPLMTWGDVIATPLRLDGGGGAGDGDVHDIEGLAALGDESEGPAGRQFTLPALRPREVAARAVTATQNGGRRGSSAATPTLDALRRSSTPARGGATPLSAAGLKLAAQLCGGGGSGGGSSGRSGLTGLAAGVRRAGGASGSHRAAGSSGVDLQLRASYARSTATPTHAASGWDSTPSAVRPLSVQRQQVGARRRSSNSSSGAQRPPPAPSPVPGKSVTDDLLQL